MDVPNPAAAECDCGSPLTPLGDDIRFRCGGCAALFVGKRTDRTPPPLVPLAMTKGGFSYRRLDPRKVDWTYGKEELDRIRRGVVVQSQDDKWGSVERNSWIYFYRVSFGTLQFAAHLSGAGVDEVQIVRDIRSVRDLNYVRWLLDTVLAGRNIPFSPEFHKTAEQAARFRGALLGLAAGDALGTTVVLWPSDSALQKGWHYLQHGQYDKAIVAFEIVLESDPNNQEAKEGKAEAMKQKAAKSAPRPAR